MSNGGVYTNGGVYICMSDLVTPPQSSGARSEWIAGTSTTLPRRVHPGYLPSQYCESTSSHRRPSIILISPRSVWELLSLVQFHDINDSRYGKGLNPWIAIRYIGTTWMSKSQELSTMYYMQNHSLRLLNKDQPQSRTLILEGRTGDQFDLMMPWAETGQPAGEHKLTTRHCHWKTAAQSPRPYRFLGPPS